ncbi:WecB/TagA/CpsF family glycosyltransferase [Chlorogloeopsis sp. ULAP01]|uniref:WecB/TagA/CpsF family glycosyltransferase n=1 Tax=Chlorogloeopsis sp. ULAP01 TaxID=3056483 RepID=UPI0025AAC301|nr:WecB/TagA/CpsF family glycosyltransferase [Chlorogloeopsis sp. ULAP01]MDM9383469.1 WecB/TagA/CpsF family glycosyltransferase [Chlorogloeopsis sp. ULAP01]
MTPATIIQMIHAACIERRQIIVANYNVHAFNLSMQLPWFYDFLQSAEVAHCDGFGILKGLQYMGLNLPIQYRVSYTILMPELLKHCNQEGFSIFLLGSKPQYLETALKRLRTQYPNIYFAGHHGYFDQEDIHQNEAVIEQINLMKPNILIVGMGMPIQENWIRQHRSCLNVNAILAGGAVIDRLAGVVSDCPSFIANLGLEWLYRLCHEPKRLAARYLLGNSAFLLHLGLAKSHKFSLHVEQRPLLTSSRLKAHSR